MTKQPLVSPVEVEALRFELAATKEKLAGDKIYYEAQIKSLTEQRDALEKQIEQIHRSTPQFKVITKRDRDRT